MSEVITLTFLSIGEILSFLELFHFGGYFRLISSNNVDMRLGNVALEIYFVCREVDSEHI